MAQPLGQQTLSSWRHSKVHLTSALLLQEDRLPLILYQTPVDCVAWLLCFACYTSVWCLQKRRREGRDRQKVEERQADLLAVAHALDCAVQRFQRRWYWLTRVYGLHSRREQLPFLWFKSGLLGRRSWEKEKKQSPWIVSVQLHLVASAGSSRQKHSSVQRIQPAYANGVKAGMQREGKRLDRQN